MVGAIYRFGLKSRESQKRTISLRDFTYFSGSCLLVYDLLIKDCSGLVFAAGLLNNIFHIIISTILLFRDGRLDRLQPFRVQFSLHTVRG